MRERLLVHVVHCHCHCHCHCRCHCQTYHLLAPPCPTTRWSRLQRLSAAKLASLVVTASAPPLVSSTASRPRGRHQAHPKSCSVDGAVQAARWQWACTGSWPRCWCRRASRLRGVARGYLQRQWAAEHPHRRCHRLRRVPPAHHRQQRHGRACEHCCWRHQPLRYRRRETVTMARSAAARVPSVRPRR